MGVDVEEEQDKDLLYLEQQTKKMLQVTSGRYRRRASSRNFFPGHDSILVDTRKNSLYFT